MLVEARRPAAVEDRGLRELRDRAGIAERCAQLGVIDVRPELPGLELSRFRDVAEIAHRHDQHPPLERTAIELGLGVREREALDRLGHAPELRGRLHPRQEARRESDPVLVPRRLVDEALLVHPLEHACRGGPDRLTEQEREVHIAIGAGIDEADARVSDAQPPADALEVAVVPAVIQHHGLGRHHHRGLRGDVDVLAPPAPFARGQRQQRAHGRLGARVEERLGHRRGERRPVLVAAQDHLPASRRHREIRRRPVRLGSDPTEGRDRDDDQTGLALDQSPRIEAPFLEPVQRSGLEQHVRSLEQPEQLRTTGVGLQIDLDRALVPVRREELEAPIGAPPIRMEGSGAAGCGAVPGLDQHDVGTEVRQDLAGDRGAAVGTVQYPMGGEHHVLSNATGRGVGQPRIAPAPASGNAAEGRPRP
jgi:hypothetical protein